MIIEKNQDIIKILLIAIMIKRNTTFMFNNNTQYIFNINLDT